MEHYGQVDANSTLRVFFTTNAGTGAAVAPSSAFEAADVRIYKDGSATQRASEAGYTMTSPFDSVTGLHLLSVDLSDNTDAGFYAAGSQYTIILVPDETVDSVSVVRVLADFKIGPVAANVTQWLGTAAATPTVAGVPEVDVTHISGSTSDVSTIPASVAAILVDTGTTLQGELDGIQADTEDIQSRLPAALVNGRMDSTVDGTGMEAAAVAAIADGVWDEAQAGHVGAGTFGEVATEVASILDDTDLIDDATSGLAKIATDVAAILVDTSTTLQGELDGIQADTEDIQSRLPAALVNGRMDSTVDGTGMEAAALAAINAEVVDALSTDTYAEPTGVPAATASLAAKIGHLHMVSRNKVETTSSKMTVYDDGDAAEFEYDLSDNGTTFTKSEANTV